MAENTEKLTLKALEEKMEAQRAEYEAKIEALEKKLAEQPQAATSSPVKKSDASDWLNEEVSFKLFKDSDKYKDDVTIGINGKLVKIRRGETVRIKRKYLMLIDQGQRQDEKTAELMNRESRRFESESRAYGG